MCELLHSAWRYWVGGVYWDRLRAKAMDYRYMTSSCHYDAYVILCLSQEQVPTPSPLKSDDLFVLTNIFLRVCRICAVVVGFCLSGCGVCGVNGSSAQHRSICKHNARHAHIYHIVRNEPPLNL